MAGLMGTGEVNENGHGADKEDDGRHRPELHVGQRGDEVPGEPGTPSGGAERRHATDQHQRVPADGVLAREAR